MTPRPEAAPAAIATTTLALRAQAVATTAAAASDRAISHHQHQQQPDASRGHFKPSRRGQCKPSFSVSRGRTTLREQLEAEAS
jgi:hypothetical protein